MKLFKKNPKNLINFEIVTNIKINYEQLHELIIIIKKNYVNKYLIIFNKESKAFIDDIINKELSDVIALDNTSDQKLKTLFKIIKAKIKVNNNDKNKSFESMKKIFNNIKIFIFDKKDIKFEYN